MSHSDFVISSDPKLLQPERIQAFLSTQAYWCAEVPLTVVLRAIAGSVCFGVYTQDKIQIGYARVVTDKATFAWLCDVYIEKPYRGQGLAYRLMESVMAHPELQGLRRFCLATQDAHSLYEPFGFKLTETPGSWMEIKDNDIYRRK